MVYDLPERVVKDIVTFAKRGILSGKLYCLDRVQGETIQKEAI